MCAGLGARCCSPLQAGGAAVLVDYVHIEAGSARFVVGDAVRAGEPLALAGAVGFAPEPHLHLEVHSADHPLGSGGPSLRFEFLPAGGGEPFAPVAGGYYTTAAPGLAPCGGPLVAAEDQAPDGPEGAAASPAAPLAGQ